MPKLEVLYVFVWCGETPEKDEEIVMYCSKNGDVRFPLFGADEDRLESLRTVAAQLEHQHGKKTRLLKFKLEQEIKV